MNNIMTNEDIFKEMKDIGEKIDTLFKQNKLKERNKLVPRCRELYRSYNFGFKTKDEVETIAWWNKWTNAKIVEHREDNYFLVQNEKGWEVYVPGTLLRKPTIPRS